MPCIVRYIIAHNYVKCLRRLFGSIFFLVYWIPNHAIWDIQAYHHPEYRVKKSCFSLTPILDTIKWVYMNTSITLSGMPCDDSPPPETHPQRHIPRENGDFGFIHKTKNTTEFTHTHSTWFIMKDISMIERGGWGTSQMPHHQEQKQGLIFSSNVGVWYY